MSIVLSAPIPGQSLTKEPKNQRFERPADTASPLVALDMHIDNITRPEALKDAFYFLESGLSLVGLVEGILRSAVMGGRHSLDVSLIIAPVLHEYIKGLALEADIEFDEGFEDAKDDGIEYNRELSFAQEMLDKVKKDKPQDEPEEMEMEDPIEEEEPMVETGDMPLTPQGLMSRRV